MDMDLETLHELAEEWKPIFECAVILAGSFALVKWVRERNNRATDVLLALEKEFELKCKHGRPLLDQDAAYQEIKEMLSDLVLTGSRSHKSTVKKVDIVDPQTAIDDLLRFYVVLIGVRIARQIPEQSLSICYRFWMATYYRKDRAELRAYVNAFFPTLSSWLLKDVCWFGRMCDHPFSRWWRSFFRPEDFWKKSQIETVRHKLMKNHERVLVITGSGISAESGIPTFRGPGGYWRNLDPEQLATKTAFAKDPKLIWQWYRERRSLIRKSKPNAAHEALVKLANVSKEFLLVTQNVDDLHARASFKGTHIAADEIVQIHGDIFITKCTRCFFCQREEDNGVEVPLCSKCNAPLRPGVVWFDEDLDSKETKRVEDFLNKPCDLVMVIGTTATFDYIVDWAQLAKRGQGKLYEINLADTAISSFATYKIREAAGIALPKLVDDLIF